MSTSSSISEIVYEIFSLIKTNNLQQNINLIKRAIESDKNNQFALLDLGVACAQNERFDDALIVFNELSKVLTEVRVFYNLGLIYSLKNEHRLAISNFELALKISPNDFACLVNKGAAHNDCKEFGEALHCLEQAIKLNGSAVEAWSNKGIALNGLGQFEHALSAYDQAIALNPNFPEVFYNKGISLNKLGRQEDALHHFNQALHINPNYAEAWLNKGNILFEKKQYAEALLNFEKAISIRPNYAEAWLNKGNVFAELGDHPIAVKSYERVLSINPSFNWVPGLLIHANMKMCNWSNLHGHLEKIIYEVNNHHRVIMPFALLSLIDDPELHKKCSEIYSAELYPQRDLRTDEPVATAGRVRVGYFSSDFYNHATSYLIAEIFELHNREDFEIIGFSYGAQISDEMNIRIRSSLDQFYDVSNKSDSDIASLARSLNIQIAIDLKGYTQDSRPGIFSYRAAPIQVNFLGYPGTMGVNYYDYILADEKIIPEQFKIFYSEKIAPLPHSYQPNDSRRQMSSKIFKRSDFGLPEDTFVFCCFNNNYKILPEMFSVWMNILDAVENSVLWLLEDNQYAAINLINEAKNRSINSKRIIFAKHLPVEEHLARHNLADLFLDTFPYNAHTTASDALFSGLPLLTLSGQSFASRVGESLLVAVDLPEFISESIESYKRKAIELALNRSVLHQAKEKLLNNRNQLKLFNSINYTRDLEMTFKKMLITSLGIHKT
jgi:protein O-GlcNAc transferase